MRPRISLMIAPAMRSLYRRSNRRAMDGPRATGAKRRIAGFDTGCAGIEAAEVRTGCSNVCSPDQ
jgi:hypothetical protein